MQKWDERFAVRQAAQGEQEGQDHLRLGLNTEVVSIIPFGRRLWRHAAEDDLKRPVSAALCSAGR